MSEDQFCLFWIDHWVTCLTKEQWAAWVQAIGGVLGLAVAIAVPWGIKRHELRVQDAADLARAHIVAAPLLMMHSQIVGYLEHLEEAIAGFLDRGDEVDFQNAHFDLAELELPEEKDLLVIQAVNQQIALSLTRGVRLLRQITHAIGMVNAANQQQTVPDIHIYLKAVLRSFRDSQSWLDSFITKLEGESTEVEDTPNQEPGK